MRRIGSIAIALLVAACTGGAGNGPAGATATAAPLPSAAASPTASAAQGTKITVKDFTLDPTSVTVAAADEELDVTNDGPTIHNVTIRASDGTVEGATRDLRTGESEALRFRLPAGTYTLFCSLPGHESLGIKGTLTVTP